jgi:hypothetical protein
MQQNIMQNAIARMQIIFKEQIHHPSARCSSQAMCSHDVHCTALHCTALHCTALHCTALHIAESVAAQCGGEPGRPLSPYLGRARPPPHLGPALPAATYVLLHSRPLLLGRIGALLAHSSRSISPAARCLHSSRHNLLTSCLPCPALSSQQVLSCSALSCPAPSCPVLP